MTPCAIQSTSAHYLMLAQKESHLGFIISMGHAHERGVAQHLVSHGALSADFGGSSRCGISDEVARAFRDDVAQVPYRTSLAGHLRRRLWPVRLMPRTLWTMRSRMASAEVGLPIRSCDLSTGVLLVMMV